MVGGQGLSDVSTRVLQVPRLFINQIATVAVAGVHKSMYKYFSPCTCTTVTTQGNCSMYHVMGIFTAT